MAITMDKLFEIIGSDRKKTQVQLHSVIRLIKQGYAENCMCERKEFNKIITSLSVNLQLLKILQ